MEVNERKCPDCTKQAQISMVKRNTRGSPATDPTKSKTVKVSSPQKADLCRLATKIKTPSNTSKTTGLNAAKPSDDGHFHQAIGYFWKSIDSKTECITQDACNRPHSLASPQSISDNEYTHKATYSDEYYCTRLILNQACKPI